MQRRLVGEPLDREQGERGEERVGRRVARWSIDGPTSGVHDHLSHRCAGCDHSHALDAIVDHRRFEEHRDGPDPAQCGLVRDAGGDPCGLLRREQVARRRGLDFGDAFEGVEQLVQVVRVPQSDQVVAVFGPRSRPDRRARTHQDRYRHIAGR